MAGFRRFSEVMAVEPDIRDMEGAKDLVDVEGRVRFENVAFSYGDREAVLRNINLQVPAGQTIAIVGPSGVGKTTLCNLIPRFYEIDSGKILIDDQNIQEVTMESLRGNIGIVQQDVVPLHGYGLLRIYFMEIWMQRRKKSWKRRKRPMPMNSSWLCLKGSRPISENVA